MDTTRQDTLREMIEAGDDVVRRLRERAVEMESAVVPLRAELAALEA